MFRRAFSVVGTPTGKGLPDVHACPVLHSCTVLELAHLMTALDWAMTWDSMPPDQRSLDELGRLGVACADLALGDLAGLFGDEFWLFAGGAVSGVWDLDVCGGGQGGGEALPAPAGTAESSDVALSGVMIGESHGE